MTGMTTSSGTPRAFARTAAAALLSALVLSGCRAPAGKAAPGDTPQAPRAAAGGTPASAPAGGAPLAGTAWRLVEIQSMDDAIGSTRVADPSRYTMRLNADGSVALRLDCNSATGTWSAEAAAPDASSGRFEFGPLAATMASCPPPRLDEQVTKQAPYFRSYLLKEGRLYLSLMADGGIFVWERSASGD
jgi:heat shock protein HslJ